MAYGTPFRENIRRLWLTILGRPPVRTGRGYVSEVLHAAMNVWVEWVRSWLSASFTRDESQATAKLLLLVLVLVPLLVWLVL